MGGLWLLPFLTVIAASPDKLSRFLWLRMHPGRALGRSNRDRRLTYPKMLLRVRATVEITSLGRRADDPILDMTV